MSGWSWEVSIHMEVYQARREWHERSRLKGSGGGAGELSGDGGARRGRSEQTFSAESGSACEDNGERGGRRVSRRSERDMRRARRSTDSELRQQYGGSRAPDRPRQRSAGGKHSCQIGRAS